LELINSWEEDQRIKERMQLELSHLRKLSHQKDIMIGRLEQKAYNVIEERDNSEAKYTLLESQFLQSAENNKLLEEENQHLKRQLADFQKREEERANEEKNKINDKKDKDEDKDEGNTGGSAEDKSKQKKDQSGAPGDSDDDSDGDKDDDKKKERQGP